MNVIVFDFETTGKHVQVDQIIQCMFLNLNTGKMLERNVKPKKKIEYEAIKKHGMTMSDLKHCPTFEQVRQDIFNFIGKKAFLIAHNADNFDKLVLFHELKRIGKDIPRGWKFIDSLKLFRYFHPEWKSHNMSFLRDQFGLSKTNEHLANKDVLDLSKIYETLRKKYTDAQLYTISQNYSKIDYGPYRGRDIHKLDKLQVQFIINQNFFQDYDLLQRLIRFKKLN